MGQLYQRRVHGSSQVSVLRLRQYKVFTKSRCVTKTLLLLLLTMAPACARLSSPSTPPDVPLVSSWTLEMVSPTESPSTRVMLSPTPLSVSTWLDVSSPTT